MPERTVREWLYQREDLFEAPYRRSRPECVFVLESGRAIAELTVRQDPVDPNLDGRIASDLEAIPLARRFQVHRAYGLEGPCIYQHAGGRKNIGIRFGGGGRREIRSASGRKTILQA